MTSAQLRVGSNRGDVLDPFILAANYELLPRSRTKQSMGATRARLVPDPERGPWVTRMFQWRVYEQLDCNGIARCLTEQGAPSRDGGPWDYAAVYNILRNPKYTGKVVFGRRGGCAG